MNGTSSPCGKTITQSAITRKDEDPDDYRNLPWQMTRDGGESRDAGQTHNLPRDAFGLLSEFRITSDKQISMDVVNRCKTLCRRYNRLKHIRRGALPACERSEEWDEGVIVPGGPRVRTCIH